MVIYKGKLIELNDSSVKREIIGEFIHLPEKGCRFCIMKNLVEGLKTSEILDVIQESDLEISFKTTDSSYKLNYYE